MAERAANGQPEIDNSGKEDIFEMQHHHLLRCLEKTTVSHKSITIHVRSLASKFSLSQADLPEGVLKNLISIQLLNRMYLSIRVLYCEQNLKFENS